jgi:microcompartment protein CcmK/EutM
MRIGEVIGTVTLSLAHPAVAGGRYRLAVPLNWANLAGEEKPGAEAIVVYDELGAGLGSHIAISEGGEAAQPFHPEEKPIDAYNAAILDRIELQLTPGGSR